MQIWKHLFNRHPKNTYYFEILKMHAEVPETIYKVIHRILLGEPRDLDSSYFIAVTVAERSLILERCRFDKWR